MGMFDWVPGIDTSPESLTRAVVLQNLGQNLQAATSHGRVPYQPLPAGALALLQENQRRAQQDQEQQQRLRAIAGQVANNPDLPEGMRSLLAAQVAAGYPKGLSDAVDYLGRPRMVPKVFNGNVVMVPEDGRGMAQPLGRVADQWEPDPNNPEMMINRANGAPMALPETPSQRAARDKAHFDALAAAQKQTQNAADDRADKRASAAMDRQEAAAQAMQERQITKLTADFGTKLNQSKIPTLQASLNKVNTLMADYVRPDSAGDYRVVKPIPGLGPLTDARGAPIALSEEGKKNRAAVTATINDMLALYSGLAVTAPEELRRAQQMMSSGAGYTDQDFINAWKISIDHYNNTLRNFKASHGEDVVKRYMASPEAPYIGDLQPFRRGYQRYDTIKGGDGKLYRVIGNDLYNPEVEEVR